MVAGIIVPAVGDELVIAHPRGDTTTATALTVLCGPVLFIAGHALFKHTMFGHFSIQRVAAVVLLVALMPVGLNGPPLLVAILALLGVVGVAVVDAVVSWTAPADREIGLRREQVTG